MLDAIFRISTVVIQSSMLISLFVLAPIVLLRRLRWERAAEAYRPLVAGLRIVPEPQPGTVFVRFTVYQGFLVWVTQMTFEFYAPPEDARRFLDRALWFSLRRGLLAAGGVLIPLVLAPSYWSQKRAIERQTAEIPPEDLRVWLGIDPGAEDPDNRSPAELPGWGTLLCWFCTLATFLATIAAIITAIARHEQTFVLPLGFLGGFATLTWYFFSGSHRGSVDRA